MRLTDHTASLPRSQAATVPSLPFLRESHLLSLKDSYCTIKNTLGPQFNNIIGYSGEDRELKGANTSQLSYIQIQPL
jgi:hypothetical protein